MFSNSWGLWFGPQTQTYTLQLGYQQCSTSKAAPFIFIILGAQNIFWSTRRDGFTLNYQSLETTLKQPRTLW